MTTYNRAFVRQFEEFRQKIDITPIPNYFGLPVTPNRSLHIDLVRDKQKNELLLRVKFEKPNTYDFPQLPTDINLTIDSYNIHFIQVVFRIVHSDNFPFQPPVWSLEGVTHNITTALDLPIYYSFIVENHNDAYKEDWSPALRIEKDVLQLLSRIRYFEAILNYK